MLIFKESILALFKRKHEWKGKKKFTYQRGSWRWSMLKRSKLGALRQVSKQKRDERWWFMKASLFAFEAVICIKLISMYIRRQYFSYLRSWRRTNESFALLMDVVPSQKNFLMSNPSEEDNYVCINKSHGMKRKRAFFIDMTVCIKRGRQVKCIKKSNFYIG